MIVSIFNVLFIRSSLIMSVFVGHVLAYMDPLTITEKIGSQPIHYSLKIPRGRWTHIAVTTSRHKMTLYMVS